MSMVNLDISCLTTCNYLNSWTYNISGSNTRFFTASNFTFTARHVHSCASRKKSLLWSSCFVLTRAITDCPLLFPNTISDSFQPGGGETHLMLSYIFAFSYFLWASPGKNTGVGCHFFLQLTMFCQLFTMIQPS